MGGRRAGRRSDREFSSIPTVVLNASGVAAPAWLALCRYSVGGAMDKRERPTFDLAVLGGAGGLTVADRVAAAGLRVALVERDRPGGECTYHGCVPTKTLVTTATLLHRMRRGRDFGLPAVRVRPDFAAIMAHKDRVIDEIS